MRRFLALVVLLAMTLAQASALACPSSHHEPSADTHAQHSGASEKPADHGANGHGTADHCIMMAGCALGTSLNGTIHSISGATSRAASFAFFTSPYLAPTLTQQTPPPRFA
jgi:hypothetical protein